MHLEKSSGSSSGLVGGLSTSGATMRTQTASGVGSITCLVSGNKLRFSKKKFTFSNSLSREPLEAHHSPPLFAAAYGESFRKHAPQAPRVGATM